MSLANLIPIMAFSLRYSHYQGESAYCFLGDLKCTTIITQETLNELRTESL